MKGCHRLREKDIEERRVHVNAPAACTTVRYYDTRFKRDQYLSEIGNITAYAEINTPLETNSSQFGSVRRTIINAFSKRTTH